MTVKRKTSHGYIIRILQHFAIKLWNITNFVMLFQAVIRGKVHSKTNALSVNITVNDTFFWFLLEFKSSESIRESEVRTNSERKWHCDKHRRTDSRQTDKTVEFTTCTGPHFWNIFQVVQTQTTAAYCRILPTLDYLTMFEISFSGSSDTNHSSLL